MINTMPNQYNEEEPMDEEYYDIYSTADGEYIKVYKTDKGYYLDINNQYDHTCDSKKQLTEYLKSRGAEFIGSDQD